MEKKKYSEKLKDPRWQKMRLQVLERDEWTCQRCFDSESTLNVHHLRYEKGKDPWEYPLDNFLTLCESCHTSEFEMRHDYEQMLLSIIREKGFLADDVYCLVKGFLKSQFSYPMDVTATIIEYALTDGFKIISEKYFNDLNNKIEKRKKERGEKNE